MKKIEYLDKINAKLLKYTNDERIKLLKKQEEFIVDMYDAFIKRACDLVIGKPRLFISCARHVYLRDFSVQEPILGVREGREAVLHPIFQFDVSYFVVWDRELYLKILAVAYNLGNLLTGAQHHSYLDVGWNIERPACGGF